MTLSISPSWPSRVWKALISPRLTVICLALLMVLTFWGTMYQVDYGLHEAKVRFFDSWWLTALGFLPFPGTQLVMAVLLVNLLGYLGHLLVREKLHVGVLMTHLGILVLLLGGAITHQYGTESHLTLSEGEASNVSTSYNDWELAVWNTDMGMRDVRAQDAGDLKAGDVLQFPEPGITVAVEAFYRNSHPFQDGVTNVPESERGITRLEAAPMEKEPERNRPGAVLSLTWAGGTTRRVLLFGEDDIHGLAVGGKTYALALRHTRYPLPVLVTLLDFKRELHPGTEMARSYSSRIAVERETMKRELTVSMNKPYREHGLTFYQASFSEDANGGEVSTFAVTRNYGRLLPYVATSMVVLGMLVHFGIMLVKRAQGDRAK